MDEYQEFNQDSSDVGPGIELPDSGTVPVVGIRFRRAGKVYHFKVEEGVAYQPEDLVIVETARGIEAGTVVVPAREISVQDVVSPLRGVIRKATSDDLVIVEENKRHAQEAFDTCEQKIREHGLPMKLVDVEFTFDVGKILFYFTADGRVDFRELVKDLASVFRTRIELRQIGVRDEAKLLGGIGPCGRELCCCTWLGEFEPVSIRMAKGQNLSLNPSKISGACGRLMCCLKYENERYCSERSKSKRQKEMAADNGSECNCSECKGE